MDQELHLEGFNASPRVFEAVVAKAAEGVEGVACLGVPGAAQKKFSYLFASDDPQPSDYPSIGVRTDAAGAVQLAVRLTVFFGYPLADLAAEVRSAVEQQVSTLIGVPVASVDVFIDALVFPKE